MRAIVIEVLLPLGTVCAKALRRFRNVEADCASKELKDLE